VPDEDMLDGTARKFVIQGQDRTAGDAGDDFYALTFKQFHHNLRTCRFNHIILQGKKKPSGSAGGFRIVYENSSPATDAFPLL